MKKLWFVFGCLFLALAIIGIALPVMPTVPFLLVATWAFTRSSPALRQKILDHPTYGPPVRAWQARGVVSRAAKIWAITAMTGGVAMTFWLGLPGWAVTIQAGICSAVALFLTTRPEA